MLTKGDDYPLHQTPEPIAYAGSDRNFYDRYFFNGYSADGSLFFAAALGIYPQLDIIDASFCLLIDGVQHNVRASRHLGGERLDLAVGPIRLEIVEPLETLRLTVAGDDIPITADIVFSVRHAPIEEPRFTRRNGSRLFMDYTRLTQNGSWAGTISCNGTDYPLAPESHKGTRDRSWGIRPVGAPDSQPPPMGSLPQFYWLWTPLNFPEHCGFFHSNDDSQGNGWNRRAVVDALANAVTDYEMPAYTVRYARGTRRVERLDVTLSDDAHLLIEPAGPVFHMSGLGYTHPVWGHGMDHGEFEVGYDKFGQADTAEPSQLYLHIQAFARATLTANGAEHVGHGVVEQLLIGPHAPSGFTALMDPAA
jgi:hypothetical protein